MRFFTCICVVVLFGITKTYAATHVNISIAQHEMINPVVDEAEAPAKLQLANNEGSSMRSDHFQEANGHNMRFTVGGHQHTVEQAHHQTPFQQQRAGQQFSQLRKAQVQKKQNQEFERYIQSYHNTGPTVETVFETSSPSPAHYEQGSVNSRENSAPARLVSIGGSRSSSRPMHTFERQVALPAASQSRQDYTQNSQAQIKPVTEVSQETALPPSSGNSNTVSSGSSTSSSSTGGSSTTSTSSNGLSSGYDQGNFDIGNSYGNHYNYDHGHFNFDDQSDLQNEYPPSIDESQGGYYDSSSGSDADTSHLLNNGYLPPPRPVVRKTIQIAQPALKAKKFEVRHPAIQKEFYDIEERVVIKPAGTIVVELEHPVAKIPKGEAILPLGIPHPAVAGAYTNNGLSVSQTQSNTVPASGQTQNQFKSSGGTTLGSAVTTTPNYDQNVDSDFIDAKLRKPYNSGENQQSTSMSTTERVLFKEKNDMQKNNDDFYISNDSQQRHTTIQNNTPKPFLPQARNDLDGHYRQAAPRGEIKHHGDQNSFSNYNGHLREDDRSYQPAQYTDGKQYKDDYFDAEYIDQANRQPQDYKPARLQEQPMKAKEMEHHGPMVTTHIIKHEHNIHLPPSQHNIFLGRMQQKPMLHNSRYEEEAARVLEIKPMHSQKRLKGPMLTYVASTTRPLTIRPQHSGRYTQDEPQHMHHMHMYHNQMHKGDTDGKGLQYSAPYSQMRFDPQQSSVHDSSLYSSKLQQQSEPKDQEKNTPHTHIQIQIPHHPDEADKPIVVSSTIAPMFMKTEKSGKYHIDSNYNSEVETFTPMRTYGGQDKKNFGQLKTEEPDCEKNIQKNGHYEQHFSRLVELPTATPATPTVSANVAATPSVATTNVGEFGSERRGVENVDLNLKSNSGHIAGNSGTGGSRVIAATPAPTDASASSESFHKRRIVVNHPFQTVREVVEHEPITNYHHVQVNEAALAPYYQMNDALRQLDDAHLPSVVYPSHMTHGNLHYAYHHHV